jgi:hypothetical protein
MRRTIGVIALALVLVGGSFTAASAATANGASDNGRSSTLHLIARTVDSADLDLGKQGPSLGDQFIFTDDVFQNGKRVGEDHGTCTITRITGTGPSTVITTPCLVTLVLPRGQVTVQGAATFTEQGPTGPFTVAVTGGTGSYKTARGEVGVRQISNTDTELTVRLIL